MLESAPVERTQQNNRAKAKALLPVHFSYNGQRVLALYGTSTIVLKLLIVESTTRMQTAAIAGCTLALGLFVHAIVLKCACVVIHYAHAQT